MKYDITDHYPIGIIIKQNIINRPEIRSNYDYQRTNLAIFSNLLSEQPWGEVISSDDPNTSSTKFIELIQSVYQRSTSSHPRRSADKRLKPWITLSLVRAIRKRNNLHRVIRRQPFNVQLINYYTEYRRVLSRLLKTTKKAYYKQKIFESTNNPKQFWKTINEISGSNNNKTPFPVQNFLSSCSGDNHTLNSSLDIANDFNKFFANIGADLAQKIRQNNANIRTIPFTPPDSESRFILREVSEQDVRQCVMGIRGGSAPGCDDIPVNLIKNNIDILLTPLCHIINCSFRTGIFPDLFKLAKVIPLHKSGSKVDLNNYRPISLLSIFSKVIEKCFKKQLTNYIKTNNLLTEFQFGFRDDCNSENCFYRLSDFLRVGINNNKYILLLFVDLTKAFDSIDRSILMRKLYKYGIAGIAHSWINSYLSERKQIVSINNTYSNVQGIDYGVVQGSTLGPVLFLLYINDIIESNIMGKILLFADDTAVYFEGDSWREVYRTANSGVVRLKKWFDSNILSMNISKTKVMPIFLHKKRAPPPQLDLKLHMCGREWDVECDCRSIESVNEIKYLGIIFDNRLSWMQHIAYLKNKLRKLIFVFSKLHGILNVKELRMVYFSFAQSIMTYGIIAWGGACDVYIKELSITQKAIIKAGLGLERTYSSDLLFNFFNVLTIKKLFIKSVMTYAFKNKIVFNNSSQHNYLTRGSYLHHSGVSRNMRSVCDRNVTYLVHVILRNAPLFVSQPGECSIYQYKRVLRGWLSALNNDECDLILRSAYV